MVVTDEGERETSGVRQALFIIRKGYIITLQMTI